MILKGRIDDFVGGICFVVYVGFVVVWFVGLIEFGGFVVVKLYDFDFVDFFKWFYLCSNDVF